MDSAVSEGGEEHPGNPPETEGATAPGAPTPAPTPTPEPTLEPNYWDLSKYYATTPTPSPTPRVEEGGPTVAPTPTPDRSIRNGPLPYALKDKVVLDKASMLPELKDIYALNDELVGWINIPDTVIDYPVVQAEDGEYYLSHDFYGEENINGQIILDALCDPYTPSYNLILSGHHMKNGSMFGGLPEYRNKSYWEKHKLLEFDSLMERKVYVVFACFYSADYDEDETGFRYNAVIDYKMDADRWLEEIEENQLYDTGIQREFGDEFITLTTCDRARHRNGRFVVVGRRIREGEMFE
jgi:SrtB family sortase